MASWIAWGEIYLGLLTGAFLLFLQIRTYRRIRYKSLLVAAIAQFFGLAYGILYVAIYLDANAAVRWTFFYIASAFFVVQCVVGALGAIMIFHSFEQAVLRQRAIPPPLVNIVNKPLE